MFSGFLFLLLLTGGSSYNHTQLEFNSSGGGSGDSYPEAPDDGHVGDLNQRKSDFPSHCTFANIINHLDLTDKVKFYMARPTKDNERPTEVILDIYLYSILDVKEKEQELVAYFLIDMFWVNEFIKWEPKDFCRTYIITIPSELLWKPDLTIEEVTVKEKLFQTQYLTVRDNGDIYQRNGMVLVSTCRMDFYRFPFDTQTCSLTFKSLQHSWEAIQLRTRYPNEDRLKSTREWMKTESEWLLMNVTVETKSVLNFHVPLSTFFYTMTIKRRSVLYVANFIVPILLFLCLDLASFLISESGGEKLSFKVTVLLAVTVMQLILNEILPSSSDRIPLIAVYCIGVFALMMMSLLETILMMYLMEKDGVSQDQEADKDQSLGEDFRDRPGKVQKCFRDMNKSIPCVRVFDESPAETPPELLPEVKEVKEGCSSQLSEETQDSENLNDELREVLNTVALLLSSRKEEKEPGYWTRMTKKLNRIYFILYLIAAAVPEAEPDQMMDEASIQEGELLLNFTVPEAEPHEEMFGEAHVQEDGERVERDDHSRVAPGATAGDVKEREGDRHMVVHLLGLELRLGLELDATKHDDKTFGPWWLKLMLATKKRCSCWLVSEVDYIIIKNGMERTDRCTEVQLDLSGQLPWCHQPIAK
ncbi:uncharacterized protein LOC141784460 [Halichoeres trimaculatus]|uniref:uncharacterized protein LOC141784460 n=1 Tax=Halichoeres trimaculatus TaxID=147232 RepID=UPI003D9F7E90